MIHIFFDIENTIIDDLWNCNFLQDRCNKVDVFANENQVGN